MIDTREELINNLTEAAELEHGLLCQYLFAAFSMKKHPADGITWAQAERIRAWERNILEVAREEMAHLGTVSNMLTAVGTILPGSIRHRGHAPRIQFAAVLALHRRALRPL